MRRKSLWLPLENRWMSVGYNGGGCRIMDFPVKTTHCRAGSRIFRRGGVDPFWEVLTSCEGWRPDSPTYYCSRRIVDFVVLRVYSVCVDRSGSLSGGAFNQWKLVTLSIVLTILYLLKSVLQRSLLQCLDSLYKSNEVF